ncbi:MAG: rRNA m(5)U-747 methyltransferase [Humibacillus sp.]|nr:rRNA m(5)U-747 methyltransferase [Humibacillus sp.]
MGVPYAAQLADKQRRCAEVLGSVAPGVRWHSPVVSAESGFRNKAKLVVGGRPEAVTLGILDETGRGVDLRACGLYEPGLHELLPRLADVIDRLGLEPYDVPSRRGELKHLLVTHSPDGEVMLRLVLRSQKHLALLRSRLPILVEALPEVVVVSVNLQPEHKAVIEGETEIVLTERGTLPMRVNDIALGLRPGSFFQTNTAVAAALYRQAQQWISESRADAVIDLYCGVGGFALHAAVLPDPPRRVLGIEVSPEAIVSAQQTVAALTSAGAVTSEVEFRTADATDPNGWDDVSDVVLQSSSLVIVNPPRRGIGPGAAQWLEQSGASTVVYSSCNVDSLARDLAALPSYDPVEARLFDMFPQTAHHEVIVRLERRADAPPVTSAKGVSS